MLQFIPVVLLINNKNMNDEETQKPADEATPVEPETAEPAEEDKAVVTEEGNEPA